MLKRVQPDDGFDGRAGVAKGLRHDRRGGVGILFGLIAPLLVLAVAFGIEVTGGYRDALALQGLADRVAVSAGPLWHAGDRSGAMQLARALAGDVTIDRQGAVDAGSDTGKKAGKYGDKHGDRHADKHADKGAAKNAGRDDAYEIIVSQRKRVFFGLIGSGRGTARAVAVGARRVE